MLQLLEQNSEFIAVDKPAGLSVHNVEDPENLLIVLKKELRITELFPVHRLDKETSGVQILALHSSAAANLAKAFEDRSVVKHYTGVLRGRLEPKEIIWDQTLSDKAEGRKNPAGLGRDRVAW